MSTCIVWLRRDLRLTDNPALAHAAAHHDRAAVVYIHAPDEDGDWAPGAASGWWLHHSLGRLGEQLRDAGSKLVVRIGPSLDALRTLAEETGAEAVYWNRLYAPAAIARDKQVKTALRDDGLDARSFNAALLAEPWTVETKSGGPYKVYTPFWKAIRERAYERAPADVGALPTAPHIASDALDDLNLLPKLDWADGFPEHWTPGAAGAHDQLTRFLDEAVTDYGDGRNRPDRRLTSELSPHLHFGEIGPREIIAAVHAAEADDPPAGFSRNADKFASELGWREFAHHLLFHFPETLEQPLNPRFAEFEWAGEDDTLDAWQRGATGIPIVDAGMRQLWQTGWMHNRVRMIVGSLLTKNLRHHWLTGARWFWDTLVDADLANNTLGWQWIAGCGADAAPYFRIFNPVTQGEKFDPNGDYVRRFVPEIASLPTKHLHAPWQAPAETLKAAGITLGKTYPHPIVDLKASRAEALAAYDKVKG